MRLLSYRLTFASLIILVIGIFTSVSITALSHVLIFIPGVYFFLEFARKFEIKGLNLSVFFMDLLTVAIVLSVLANWEELANPHKNLFKVKYFLICLLSIFAYRETFKNYIDDKKIKILLRLFLLATSVATISGLIGVFTGFNPIKMKEACHATRACGLYGMYMTYGYGISLFMILITGALLYKKELEKYLAPWMIYTAFAINLVGLYFSYARGAWIGFLLAVPFFFLKKNITKFMGVIGVSVMAFGIAFVFSPTVKKMFLKRGASNDQRISFYKAAYEGFKEKPVFGWGYRNFEPNMKEIKKRHNIKYPHFGSHAHNNFLEHLASTGIVGVMVVLLWHFYWLIESYRGRSLISRLSFPFVISFIVSGMVQYTFGDGENLFLILNLWALGQLEGSEIS